MKLENHERIHDGNQNIKWCHLCETAWPNTQNLRFHVKGVHEKQKDHKCNECSKAFVHPSQLKKHIATVHEGQTLPCPLCQRQFKFKVNLEHHIRKVHENPSEEQPQPLPTQLPSQTQQQSLALQLPLPLNWNMGKNFKICLRKIGPVYDKYWLFVMSLKANILV